MERYSDTHWYLSDTPHGPARALRGTLRFIEIDPDDWGLVSTTEKEVCPLSFSVTIHEMIAGCDADRCLLIAHALHYTREEAFALLHAIDGVPGCDETLRAAILDVLLPHREATT